jgi:hypothetical protein
VSWRPQSECEMNATVVEPIIERLESAARPTR